MSGKGLGIANSALETVKIHQENQAKLQAMSQSEIQEEQRRLLAQLGELDAILTFLVPKIKPFKM